MKRATSHNGERLLKARYLTLRTMLREIADYSPHFGNGRNRCAPSCPACCASHALTEDAAHGRVVDDRSREERE